MKLLVRAYAYVCDRLGWDRTTTAEVQAWQQARTLADLGNLTVSWLTGRIRHLPGYRSPLDVDEDIAPGMTAALIALNEAGLVTFDSQGGFEGVHYDNGEYWGKSESYVWFLADDDSWAWLRSVLDGSPFEAAAARAGDDGAFWSVEDLRDDWVGFGLCHPDLVAAVCEAWQVRINDPVPGRNILWTFLHAAASGGWANRAS